jgi:DNA-binding beta-propeller fold protein YncE
MISTFAKSCLILIVMVFVTTTSWVQAAVEISLEKTLQTEAAPMDVTLSPDGKSAFVLTDDGNVLVYDHLGNLKDTIKVGSHIDQIEIDPSGERLFASSRRNKTVEIILLTFIHNINTENSAFKGPQDAPVTIVVFSEFQ